MFEKRTAAEPLYSYGSKLEVFAVKPTASGGT